MGNIKSMRDFTAYAIILKRTCFALYLVKMVMGRSSSKNWSTVINLNMLNKWLVP